MKRGWTAFASSLVAAALAAAAAPAGAAPPPAGTHGIRVYTWTDASGVTHFSDKPRTAGTQKTLTLPVPPPPNQTALAAQRAWLKRIDRETQADLARQSRQRRARATAPPTFQAPPEQPVAYYPAWYPAYRHHRLHGHRHRRDHDERDEPDRRRGPRFPFGPAQSSFPEPVLQSSFVGGLQSSFPERPPPHRHR